METVQSNFDLSNAELIVKQRRPINQFCVDLLRVYLVAGSLETLDEQFSVIRKRIHDLISGLPRHCIGHCLHRVVICNSD